MNVDYDFRHRNIRRGHYQMVEKALLIGYPKLSHGARLLWMVLDGFDFIISGTDGLSKGYAYPTQNTLAGLLDTSTRTIQRWISELVDVELLSVEITTTTKGRRNIYWIEDPSEEAFDFYLEKVQKTHRHLIEAAKAQVKGDDDKNVATPHSDKNVVMGDDKNVVTPKPPKPASNGRLRPENGAGRNKKFEEVKDEKPLYARIEAEAAQKEMAASFDLGRAEGPVDSGESTEGRARDVSSSSQRRKNARQTKKAREMRRALRQDYPPEFEAFWQAYPRKVAKAAAFKEWQFVLETQDITNEQLIKAAKAYAYDMEREQRDPSKIKYAQGWFKEYLPDYIAPDGTEQPALNHYERYLQVLRRSGTEGGGPL